MQVFVLKCVSVFCHLTSDDQLDLNLQLPYEHHGWCMCTDCTAGTPTVLYLRSYTIFHTLMVNRLLHALQSRNPEVCSTSSLCATITICCWRDFHLCSMLWTASRTIKTLTRSSVVCWGKLMATTHFSDWIWVHVCHEIGFRLNQGWNAQTFSLCGFLGLCVRWNWIRKRSQFENDTVGVHTRGVEIVLNAVRSGHKRAW